jgi:putative flippase GtrA
LKIFGLSVEKLIRFAAGGVLSSGVTLGVTALLHELVGVSESVAAAGGLATALIVNFVFLRIVVFGSRAAPIMHQLAKFLASSGAFRAFEYVAFLIVNSLFPIHYLVALILVLGSSFLLKFLVYERFVFVHRDAAQVREEPR